MRNGGATKFLASLTRNSTLPEGVARITDDVRDGVIVATLGYWRSLNRSDGSVNSISSDAFCSLGRAPTFSDNLVQVTRVN